MKTNKIMTNISKIVLILMIICIVMCTASCETSSSSRTEQCKYCHRTFSDRTNMNYIWHTNLCRNCYRTMCFANGITPKNYDK